MHDINIKSAGIYQIEDIIEIGSKTFYQTWRPVNTEEDLQLYLKKAFASEEIVASIKAGHIYYIAYIGEARVGYYKLRTDRNHEIFNGSKAIEMERIYVFNEFQKQKVGKALMDHAIANAKKLQFNWLWLGVNVDNNKAIPFYKSYGFTIFGTKQFKLGNAIDEDYLMKCPL
jgi:ribosomal protein S18 acetylase RimI-like enzyme